MGKLFISYRRDDTQDITGRLFERLARRFGENNIFMDVDSIPIGADFRQILRDAIADSSVALVMIGRLWLTVTDAQGQRRLDNPNDFVRIEVEAALARNIPVVPILTQGVAMPHERDLPTSMSALAFRHGVDVRSDQHFGPDAEQLIARLASLLEPNPVYPLPDVPPRLASLGFRGVNLTGTPAIIPPLVEVAAGRFLMGSDPKQDPVARNDAWAKREMPQDWVEVDTFQIGKYPVTVAEYALAVNAKAVHELPVEGIVTWQKQLQRLDHPVVCVSWQDANTYLTWLRSVTSEEGWRLPSEAQWEKAARWDADANTSRIYPWGRPFDQARCNTSESDHKTTTPVGSYPASDAQRSGASPCGAEEMAGNVWEWTSSLNKPYPYILSDGREAPDPTVNRILRGGSWLNAATSARAAFRLGSRPDLMYNRSVGFRLALSAWAGS